MMRMHKFKKLSICHLNYKKIQNPINGFLVLLFVCDSHHFVHLELFYYQMSATRKTEVVDKQYMPESKENQFRTVVVITSFLLSHYRKHMKTSSGLKDLSWLNLF